MSCWATCWSLWAAVLRVMAWLSALCMASMPCHDLNVIATVHCCVEIIVFYLSIYLSVCLSIYLWNSYSATSRKVTTQALSAQAWAKIKILRNF